MPARKAKKKAQKKAPGPKPALTPDRIARAAIGVADAEGLAAISMQRIAREVHVTTMALYRYFSSKAELINLMIDTAGGPAPDLNVGPQGWRHKLNQWTRQCSAVYLHHPWFLQAVIARPRIMGPNELAWLDAALAALAETGLPAREQHQAFLVLLGHVRSNAEFTAASAPHPAGSPEDGLEFGLQCILDGIESRVGGQRL